MAAAHLFEVVEVLNLFVRQEVPVSGWADEFVEEFFCVLVVRVPQSNEAGYQQECEGWNDQQQVHQAEVEGQVEAQDDPVVLEILLRFLVLAVIG